MQTPSAPAQRQEAASKPDAQNLQQLRGAIRAFVFGKVRDPALAEDITQETLLRLHQRFDTLREADRLQAWVFQIARNAVADHYRSAKATESFDEQTHAPSPEPESHGPVAAEEEALRHELAAYVRSVVEGLPEIYRDALKLTEFEGNTQVELARRLGLSVSAAKSRVQRARAMVREEMERCCRWETDRYGNVVEAQAKVPSRCDCDGERRISPPSP